ncbi:MAG TPA: hypothetical protein VK021_13645 [Flavobacteriaceae bacterium]|nr:hypothetical protein [Flavobacteriaceae bacterium]
MIDYRISEHNSLNIHLKKEEAQEEDFILPEILFKQLENIKVRNFSKNNPCFEFQSGESIHQLSAGYYIGLDWLGTTGKTLQIEPKLNAKLTEYFNQVTQEGDEEDIETSVQELDESQDKNQDYKEVDYLKMLLDIMAYEETASQIPKVFKIYWEEETIEIRQKEDRLTPFLVVQFLQLLKRIVQKGLKKSYYKVQKNLPNKVKGKILVSAHLKQNQFKNRLTSTYCEYQEFGIDNLENRFLKKVLYFCSSYVQNHKEDIFKKNFREIRHILQYCRPAFEQVGDELSNLRKLSVSSNAFFVEYKEALKIGKYILNQFSFNITQTGEEKLKSYPFWIDMPILFELYFYTKLLKANLEQKHQIKYQFTTYGNSLDFLIANQEAPLIIDTKYKPHYNKGQIHEDIRQVSGYARLKKVRNLVRKNDDSLIKCLIVYPLIDTAESEPDLDLKQLNQQLTKTSATAIKAYEEMYKIGINLPLV